MQPRQKPAQAGELLFRQLRLETSRTLRKERKHHTAGRENTLSAFIPKRRDDRDFVLFERLQKVVLGLNRLAAPPARTIEFDDDVRTFFHLDIVHAVLQRMEGEESTRAAPAQFLGRGKNDFGQNLQEII